MRRVPAAAVGAAVLLCAACGSPHSAGNTASAARTSAPATYAASPTYPTLPAGDDLGFLRPAAPVSAASAARTSQISCTGSIGGSDSVAIVQMHSGGTVLRDYADVQDPRTVCTFPPNTFQVTLIDSRHVLMAGYGGDLYAVVELPDVKTRWFQLPAGLGARLLGISPNLDEVTYLVSDYSANIDHIHVATRGADKEVASVPAIYGRCGSPDDSKEGDFTHSGRFAYVLDQSVHQVASLLVLKDGQVVYQLIPQGQWSAGEAPGMAVWSPKSETLYYAKDGDVWKWNAAGGVAKFLPSVTWWYPTISADGAHLAYAVLRSDGLHNVYLVDLVHGGAPQQIGKGARNLPVFLNSTQLWYRSEGQGICGPGGDQPLVYDLADGSEASSIVDFVGSVWPSTSSNF